MRSIITGSRAPLLAVIGILGCESRYVYTPEAANVLSRSGTPAERIDVPQERPNGSVQILSEGIHRVATAEGRIRVLHVRMIVSNDGDRAPWRVDAGKQLADLPGRGPSAPILVGAKTVAPIEIPEHARRTIDLYYALPAGVTDRSQPRQLGLVWTVDTPERTVSSRTTFDRTYSHDDYDAYGYGYGYGYGPWWGWGEYWGYSAFNPGFVFPRVRRIAIVPGPAPRPGGL